jgi:Domain of Unknown Function (DUF1080)
MQRSVLWLLFLFSGVSACSHVPTSTSTAASARWTELPVEPTLQAWVTRGGRYDGDARWTVEDGALTGRQGPQGEGGLIYTRGIYADFRFRCEFRIEEPMDSGIFLCMVPGLRGYQVTIDTPSGGELGGIYSDGWLQHNPQGWQHFRRGEWNQLELAFGDVFGDGSARLEATLNGQALVRFDLRRDDPAFAKAGRIGLQVHGGQGMSAQTKVQYRKLAVQGQELSSQPLFEGHPERLSLTKAGQLLGWRSLWDGSTLAGWEVHGDAEGVRVEGGAIELAAGGGELATVVDFQDFELRLDFQISEMANSGLFLRAKRDGSNPAFSGAEIQILDDFRWETTTKTTLQPWQFSGSLYGAVANPARWALRPCGEWNTYFLRYQGSQLQVVLNGVELYSVDTHTLAVDPPFQARAARGFIGLQRHGGAHDGPTRARFRNLFVRTL